MKRTLLVGFMMVAVLGMAFSQDVVLSAGPKAGLNLGWITGSDWDDILDSMDLDNGLAVGVAVGGFVEIAFGTQFSLQPEILFFQQKGRATGEAGGEDVTVTFTANTLQIPVLLKGSFAVGQGTLFVVGGPTANFVMGDVKAEIEVGSSTTDEDAEPDNEFLFGAALGGGYEWSGIGPGTLSAELRYSRIFSQYEDDADVYNNVVSLLVGYGFDL
jgi:hypothetical protein